MRMLLPSLGGRGDDVSNRLSHFVAPARDAAWLLHPRSRVSRRSTSWGALIALQLLTLPLAGCVGVPDFYVAGSSEKAPKAATILCRDQASGLAAPDINTSPRPTSNEAQAGTLIGNSVGDAILFRRTYSKCMEEAGYARRD